MKQTQQQGAAQAARPNHAHSVAGPQQSPVNPTSAPGHPFAALSSNSARVGMVIAQRKAISENGLPDSLKSGIETLSGMSMDHVKVHYNSPEPARLGAHAYAQGSDIHLASGQEKHLPHEAWHVVQQAQGRVKPTLQMKSGAQINDDTGLEHEADAMGERALSMSSVPVSRTVASPAVSRVSQARTAVIQRTVIADIAAGIVKAVSKEGIAQVGAKMIAPLITEIDKTVPQLVEGATREWLTANPDGANVLRLAIAAKTLENLSPEGNAAFQSLLDACKERFGGVLSELGKKISETTSGLLPTQVTDMKTAMDEQFLTLSTSVKDRLPEILRSELYSMLSALFSASLSYGIKTGFEKIIGFGMPMDKVAAYASQTFAAAAPVVEAKKIIDVATQGMDAVNRVTDTFDSMGEGIMRLPGIQQASDAIASKSEKFAALFPKGVGEIFMESKPGTPGFVTRMTEKSVGRMVGSGDALASTKEVLGQSKEVATASGRKAAEEKIAEGASDWTSTLKTGIYVARGMHHMSSAPKGQEARAAGEMGTSMALSAAVPAAIAAIVGTTGAAPVVLGMAAGKYALDSPIGRELIKKGGELSEEITQIPLIGHPYQKVMQVSTLVSSATATGLRALQSQFSSGSDTALDSAIDHTEGALDALLSGWSLGNLFLGATVPRKAETKETANIPKLTPQQRSQKKRRHWQRLVMKTPEPHQKIYRKLLWQKAYNGEWPPKF